MEKINILIVDDSPGDIGGLDRLLQREDTCIIRTTDPAEAVRISQEMNITIAMINMEGTGINGSELAKILKGGPQAEETLIIFLTAIAEETKYTVQGFQAGTPVYMCKPVNSFTSSTEIDSLIQLVRDRRLKEEKNKELNLDQEDLFNNMELAKQSTRVKNTFLNDMSRDIRPPINGIIGIAQLLKKTALTEEQREMVNLLEISSNSLLDVINEIPNQSGIGTEQGLSSLKNLAELKGGVLEVQNQELQGSTFCSTNWHEVSKKITLNKKTMEQPLVPLNHIKVLVAEDNPINKLLIIKILQNWQIETDVVENGKKALEKLREKDYNLILMDTFMPVMNGLEAIKLIREGYACGKENIPIITFSAAIMETDKENAIAAGANDVISKPFEPAALHKKILEFAIG